MKIQTCILLFVCFFWGLSSCSDDYMPESGLPGNPPVPVAIELHTHTASYTQPTTKADETLVNPPMVLIFTGTDMNAIFSEAAQSTYNGSATKVFLTETGSASIAIVIANMPGNRFFNGVTEVDFTVENLTTALSGKTILQIETEGYLRTERLAASLQTTPPFSGTASVLPMSGIIQLPSGIHAGISIGSAGSEVSLIRAVSKTTLRMGSGFSGDFKMEWIGVINAPRNGNLYSTGTILYTNDLTDYLSGTGDGVTGMIPVTNNTNEANPIYLYDSEATNNTTLILKAKIGGQSYYYKLSYYEPDMETHLNLYRNKHYIFTITQVEKGYLTMQDALNSRVPLLGYDITVEDDYSFEITSNGYYYLGLTNSRVEVYTNTTMSLSPAFTLATDAWSGLGVTSVTLVPQGGISVSPATIPLPDTLGTIITPVSVTMPSTVHSATIRITIGNFYKTITINRFPDMSGEQMALPYDDYFSCEIINRGVGNWLSVSNGRTISGEGFVLSPPGPLYLTASAGSGTRSGGELYTVRDLHGAPMQRTKVFVSCVNN